MAVQVHSIQQTPFVCWNGAPEARMTMMTLLCFAALVPGVFLLILAILKKAEETRQMNQLKARMQQRAQADSDVAWLRNKQMRMD